MQEVVEIRDGQAEDRQEDGRRQRFAPALVGAHLAVGDELVDHPVGECAHVAGERRDALGGEDRVEQAPILAVFGTVEPQGDGRPTAAEILRRLLDVVVLVDVEDVGHPQQHDELVTDPLDRAARRPLDVHRHRFGGGPGRRTLGIAERQRSVRELRRHRVELGHATQSTTTDPPRRGTRLDRAGLSCRRGQASGCAGRRGTARHGPAPARAVAPAPAR